jgi:hypothetical protein
MSEMQTRKWLPLGLAASRIPGNPHCATVTRWALKGVIAGPNGRRIKLPTQKVGGRRYTCQAWIDEFIAHVSGRRATDEGMSAQRAADIAADEHELDMDGIA